MQTRHFGDRVDIYKYSTIYSLLAHTRTTLVDVPMAAVSSRSTVFTNDSAINLALNHYSEIQSSKIPTSDLLALRSKSLNLEGVEYSLFPQLVADDMEARHKWRASLISEINNFNSRTTLVFLDPDEGIQPARTFDHRHVMRDDISAIWNETNASVLIYQSYSKRDSIRNKMNVLAKIGFDARLVTSFQFAHGTLLLAARDLEHARIFAQSSVRLSKLRVFGNSISEGPLLTYGRMSSWDKLEKIVA